MPLILETRHRMRNNRVLAWRSTLRFADGAPADLVIGQVGFDAVFANSGATTPSASSLDTPRGLAITSDGDLFVADSGNNRVLRFKRPFEQTGKPQANLVLGQSAFSTKGSAFTNAGTTRNPSDVEVGPDGRIYVADTGNNAVRRVAASGHVSTVAGGFNGPLDVAVDRALRHLELGRQGGGGEATPCLEEEQQLDESCGAHRAEDTRWWRPGLVRSGRPGSR